MRKFRSWKVLDLEGEQIFTEQEILEQYYHYWALAMYKAGKILMVTKENCIEDWVVINWAEEIK